MDILVHKSGFPDGSVLEKERAMSHREYWTGAFLPEDGIEAQSRNIPHVWGIDLLKCVSGMILASTEL